MLEFHFPGALTLPWKWLLISQILSFAEIGLPFSRNASWVLEFFLPGAWILPGKWLTISQILRIAEIGLLGLRNASLESRYAILRSWEMCQSSMLGYNNCYFRIDPKEGAKKQNYSTHFCLLPLTGQLNGSHCKVTPVRLTSALQWTNPNFRGVILTPPPEIVSPQGTHSLSAF